MQIVGDELHPMGRVKDFAPYASKIKASGAQAVITGNWGNDLTLLVKAAREVGFDGSFYTFYGNALGAPAAIGEAGIGQVIAVADWLPNVQTAQSEAFYQSFRQRFPKPADDYVHMRMQLMVEALAQAIERAGSVDAVARGARAGAGRRHAARARRGRMRAADHQFQQPLVVGVMDRQGTPGREVRRRRLGLRLPRGADHPAGAGRNAAPAARWRGPELTGYRTMRQAILNLEASKIREVANAGMGRSDVLAFWFGESDEVTPDFIRQAAIESLQQGETFYAHNLGLPELREAIAALHEPAASRTVDADRIADHLRRRQCADAGGAGAGRCGRRGGGRHAGLAQPDGAAARSWARRLRCVSLRPQGGAWTLDLAGAAARPSRPRPGC